MRKEKFIYNTQTLRYEKVTEPLQTKLLRLFGFVCAAVFTAFIFTLISHKIFPSPKEEALLRELDQMKAQYGEISRDMERMENVLLNIQERDAMAHRMIFGMDPIDKDVWEMGIGGHDRYADFRQFKHSGEVMADINQQADKLNKQLVLQSQSLDTIMHLAEEKEKMLAAMPTIRPVLTKKKLNVLSGFGMRIHPIFKIPKMHAGIDFTAPSGTPIQATGDGKIDRIERKRTGYGHNVVINHGYGYKTLYAHMSKINVKVGQKVKKGQVIGLVGSTGTSTAPHCHYEVLYKGKKVNPIHYCMDGLNPEEYKELVEAAANSNQSFD